MVGGNLIGSRLADKALMPTIGGLLIWSAAIQLLYVLTCHHPVAAALTVVLVGSAVAIGPALQIRLMDVAGDAQALAAALNHSAFNLANALGAWLGGLAIDAGLGYPSTGWVGTLLSLGGFGVFWWARQDARRAQAPGTALAG
jgi:DHA1 family inner membrane transport protein